MSASTQPHTARSLDGGYERKLRNEQDNFRDQSNVHDLPPIFHYWADTYVRPMAAEYGFTNAEQLYAKYLALSARAAPREAAVFLSLGAGNCDAEVRVARTLRDGGLADFVIECLDLNPAMLERGRVLAEEAGVADNVAFLEGDFNKWMARRPYTAVIANQALHHILALEHVYDEVKQCLLPHGCFVTSDMIGRNGHLRWPEALREVQRFWRELPVEYRWNRALERYEEEYIDHDCSTDAFEGVRAQDVLPLLLERFDFPLFVAFGNVINVFVDRNFGFHFDDNAAWDRDFIDRVHAFDERAILSGAITPTQMFAVMTSKPCAEHRYSRGLSPRQCVRSESHAAAPIAGLAVATTSLRPCGEGSVKYRQQLKARGGQAPYVWSAQGLPRGLDLSPAGFLSGKVRVPGVYTPEITATDGSAAGLSVAQRYTILVREDQITSELVLTMRDRLRNGRVNCGHQQRIVAQGGMPPYSWSVVEGMLPPGLGLNAGRGVISGAPTVQGNSRFAVQVMDSDSETASAEFELSIDPDRGPGRFVLPQVACGDGWRTLLHLVNPSPSALEVSVGFWSDGGRPLALPLNVGGAGRAEDQISDKVVSTLAPGSGLDIETGDQGGPERSGWAEIMCSGPLTGYAEFESLSAGRATAEFVSLCESSFLLPFDNTDGRQIGVALVNAHCSASASVMATIWDNDWAELDVQSIELPVKGHQSFMLAARFPVTAGKRGVIEFRAAAEREISGLGLQFDSSGRFAVSPRLVAPYQR